VRTGPGNIDAKAVRRLGSGRLTVDARIDLHGMRQSEAHSALRAFLWRAVAKGNRMVLVITGKGGRRPPAAADFGDAAWLGDASIEPGVLRQQVPLWLREPEFAPLVVGYTTAHIRHGGEGALYVQLRRRG
jgi:DNA-nicking Smr family endonuclease